MPAHCAKHSSYYLSCLVVPGTWADLYIGTQGLIFVIDSNDRDRIDEARTELTRIIQDREMKDALLLVFANKQDLPGGMWRTSHEGNRYRLLTINSHAT